MKWTLFSWCKYRRFGFHLEFVPQDVWFGLYWKPRYSEMFDWVHEAYVCLIPCLPLHIYWSYKNPDAA
jgi:hypothetical protein